VDSRPAFLHASDSPALRGRPGGLHRPPARQASPLVREGTWQDGGRTATGQTREQAIRVDEGLPPWRRIELQLDTPSESGESVLWLWSNLPATIDARQIADLYRRRWRIEGMFQRMESVLQSEIRSLGRPRAALLGFAVAVLACNLLAVLKRSVEQAYREQLPEGWEASPYHLAVQVRSRLRGDTRRTAGGALAGLGRRFGLRTGTAPVGVGTAHQAQPGGHEQAWSQGEKDQGVGRWCHGPRACLDGPCNRGLERQKPLKGLGLKPGLLKETSGAERLKKTSNLAG